MGSAEGLRVVPGVVLVQEAGRRAVGERLRERGPARRAAVRITVPDGRGRRGVAGHGVAVVGAVLQRHLAVLVELLELGAAVLEPDLHLAGRDKGVSAPRRLAVGFREGTPWVCVFFLGGGTRTRGTSWEATCVGGLWGASTQQVPWGATCDMGAIGTPDTPWEATCDTGVTRTPDTIWEATCDTGAIGTPEILREASCDMGVMGTPDTPQETTYPIGITGTPDTPWGATYAVGIWGPRTHRAP